MTKTGRRNEALLACPHCGKEQIEPGLAISTFCRSCGEHYQIENGVALPPMGAGDPGPRFRSTITEGEEPKNQGFDHQEPDISNPKSGPPTLGLPEKRSFFGLGRLLHHSHNKDTSVEVEKKPIRCFECGHIHEVSIAATSTQCARCSLYIGLNDLDIREQYSRNIRTRGDVTIHRKGSIIGCEIACHNLTVLGKISGSVDCSGNAVFKNSGKILGSMHCKHIVVERKCELDFPQGIIAESADIHGTVRGNILCSGTVHIFKTGSVLGDATAKAIVMKDGGVLTGQMNIQPDVDISLPGKGTARDKSPATTKEKKTKAVKKPNAQKETEALKKPDAPKETKAVEKPDAPKETKAVEKPDAPKETEAVEKPNAPKETKAVEKPDAPKETEAVEKPNTPKETEAVEKPDTPKETEAVEKPDTPKETKAVEKPDAPKETEAVEKPDAPKETEAVEKPNVSKETSVENTSPKKRDLGTEKATNDTASNKGQKGQKSAKEEDEGQPGNGQKPKQSIKEKKPADKPRTDKQSPAEEEPFELIP